MRGDPEHIVCLDGGWAVELERRGMSTGCPGLLNIAQPGQISALATDYIQAGAQVLLTNTRGANRVALDARGAGDRAAEVCEAGAQIARRAVAGTACEVYGSLGPTGLVLMAGQISATRAKSAFAESVEALEWGGVDGILLEGFSEVAELQLAIEAVREQTSLPVVATMRFDAGADRTATGMGAKPPQLARLGKLNRLDGVGTFCGLGPDHATGLVEQLRAGWDGPIWAKPSAGQVRVIDRRETYPFGPAGFAGWIPKLVDAGATHIGGCCGCGPGFVREVRAAVDAVNGTRQ